MNYSNLLCSIQVSSLWILFPSPQTLSWSTLEERVGEEKRMLTDSPTELSALGSAAEKGEHVIWNHAELA